ncbi:MAG: glycosyltransferase [Bacteroidales bacterium]|nr:glycosyltransferase [Bacteroidales bacterium]
MKPKVKRIIISVSNDIVTDQRINKVSETLMESGVEVVVVGRRLKDSFINNDLPYKTKRFKLLFNKGPFFYAALNFRLFFYLLFTRFDYLLANDLDTLLSNYIVSKLKKRPLVYDTHEYFTELPELVDRKFVRSVWLRLENYMFPKLKYVYTVNDSIAQFYASKYNIKVDVVRNVQKKFNANGNFTLPLNLQDKDIIIYIGALNMGRGIELAMEAMKYLDNMVLVIAGYGYLSEKLQEIARASSECDRIYFLGRLMPEELFQYSAKAQIGISLEENLGLNYYYSLPNKIFTYIQSRTPVLGRDYPEVCKIINRYNIGMTTLTTDARELANVIIDMISDQNRYNDWKRNLDKAAEELCWENESLKLKGIYAAIGFEFN